MKNIEKIAIDTIVENLITKYREMIEASISARVAVETAQQNYKKIASQVLVAVKEASTILLQDDVSDEALKYFEDSISERTKLQFKAKG